MNCESKYAEILASFLSSKDQVLRLKFDNRTTTMKYFSSLKRLIRMEEIDRQVFIDIFIRKRSTIYLIKD